MSTELRSGFACTECGEWHDELPLQYSFKHPRAIMDVPPVEREQRIVITPDQCVVDNSSFYLRGRILIPITGLDDPFVWGVWAEVGPPTSSVSTIDGTRPTAKMIRLFRVTSTRRSLSSAIPSTFRSTSRLRSLVNGQDSPSLTPIILSPSSSATASPLSARRRSPRWSSTAASRSNPLSRPALAACSHKTAHAEIRKQ